MKISAASRSSFGDAIASCVDRAAAAQRRLRRAHIEDQYVRATDGQQTEYHVRMTVTFGE